MLELVRGAACGKGGQSGFRRRIGGAAEKGELSGSIKELQEFKGGGPPGRGRFLGRKRSPGRVYCCTV